LERLKIKIQRALSILVLLFSLIAISALPANAHTSLELSTPSDGQSIKFMPAVLSASFDEDLIEIEGKVVNTLELESADGTRYMLSSATITGPTVSSNAADGEYPAGDYLLKYRVVSADGHPISGEIAFSTQLSTTIESDLGVEVVYQEEEQDRYLLNIGFLMIGAIFLLLSLYFGVRFIRKSSQ
jgi:methionine-rich copper-binding protein CopC